MSTDPTEVKEVLELEVHRGRERVGTLTRDERGASFAYERGYARAHHRDDSRAVAFAMPVRDEPYRARGVNLHPFFAGLLPEGLRLRALVRGLKTSEDDLFSMLAAVGKDTVGDVWVRSLGGPFAPELALVDTGELEQTSFAELLSRSLDWTAGGDSITVAGIQPKVSAARISLPLRSRSRAHILKLSAPEFPRLVENEDFFMRLARSLRLPTAKVQLVHDREGAAGLLVERFDRVAREAENEPSLTRIHQEDACQLLDRYPADKYRLGLREIAEALEVCSAPLVERLRLLQIQAVSYAIGNGDLHGKNISVQVVQGIVRLTPVYDLLSTLPYGDTKLALKLEGRDENLRRADFIDFGERVGVRRAATESMLDALIAGIGPHLGRLGEIGLGERETGHLERVIGERLQGLEPARARS